MITYMYIHCLYYYITNWRKYTGCPKKVTEFQIVITLCMKLSWFCHTNGRQLFCNCLLFVIALVPGHFFYRKPNETCCHSVVASKWLKLGQFALQLKTQIEIIKSLIVQRLKKLEEQCIHHFNLINYDYGSLASGS